MESRIPVDFATKSNQRVFIIHGIATEDILNTIKLDLKQRASKMVNGYCLPALSGISESAYKLPFKYFGVSVVYGTKDFTSDEALNLKSEIVYMVSPKELCKKFASAEITDVEFIKGSEIYIGGREDNGIKKIDIIQNSK